MKALKRYSRAPLPFNGQKRQFLNHFKTVLNQGIAQDGTGWTIVDVFGGSGLLAHTAKRLKPGARVIFNDFDDYVTRLRHIPDTNRLRRQLCDLLHPIPRGHKLPENMQQAVKEALIQFDGYVDYHSVASWLLHSAQQVRDLEQLLKACYYNGVRMSDYPDAGDYLDGLEIVAQSYQDLLPRFAAQDKVLFLFDPPYVNTKQGMYANPAYFGMVEFLKLIRMVRPPFVFFSSTRSELLDYLDFAIGERVGNWQHFAGYKKISIKTTINQTAQYEDNMVFKWDAS